MRPEGFAEEEACEYCVTWAAEVGMEVQQSFEYTWFPFDVQTIEVEFTVEGAHLYTCSGQHGLHGEDELELSQVYK